eukprot:SAG22_NODE_2567_length_2433_cov_5.410883_2_plen_190_part_00
MDVPAAVPDVPEQPLSPLLDAAEEAAAAALASGGSRDAGLASDEALGQQPALPYRQLREAVKARLGRQLTSEELQELSAFLTGRRRLPYLPGGGGSGGSGGGSNGSGKGQPAPLLTVVVTTSPCRGGPLVHRALFRRLARSLQLVLSAAVADRVRVIVVCDGYRLVKDGQKERLKVSAEPRQRDHLGGR